VGTYAGEGESQENGGKEMSLIFIDEVEVLVHDGREVEGC
jgi:hypothetical protein